MGDEHNFSRVSTVSQTLVSFLDGKHQQNSEQHPPPPNKKKKHVLLDCASVFFSGMFQPTIFWFKILKKRWQNSKKRTRNLGIRTRFIPAMVWKLVPILTISLEIVMARAEVFRAVNPKLKAEVSCESKEFGRGPSSCFFSWMFFVAPGLFGLFWFVLVAWFVCLFLCLFVLFCFVLVAWFVSLFLCLFVLFFL